MENMNPDRYASETFYRLCSISDYLDADVGCFSVLRCLQKSPLTLFEISKRTRISSLKRCADILEHLLRSGLVDLTSRRFHEVGLYYRLQENLPPRFSLRRWFLRVFEILRARLRRVIESLPVHVALVKKSPNNRVIEPSDTDVGSTLT